jgi:hypothetical protein
MLFLELHLEAAAGHDSRVAAPAGFMIQINTVHVEAGTDLLDLPFVTRQLFVKYLQCRGNLIMSSFLEVIYES